MVPVGKGASSTPLHAGAGANDWNVPFGLRSATYMVCSRNSAICSCVTVLLPGTKSEVGGHTWSLQVQLTDGGGAVGVQRVAGVILEVAYQRELAQHSHARDLELRDAQADRQSDGAIGSVGQIRIDKAGREPDAARSEL